MCALKMSCVTDWESFPVEHISHAENARRDVSITLNSPSSKELLSEYSPDKHSTIGFNIGKMEDSESKFGNALQWRQ